MIGRVTEGHQYVLRHHGKVVTDIPVSSLTEDVLEEPSEERVPQRILDAKKAPEYVPEVEDANEMLKKSWPNQRLLLKKCLLKHMIRKSELQLLSDLVLIPAYCACAEQRKDFQ